MIRWTAKQHKDSGVALEKSQYLKRAKFIKKETLAYIDASVYLLIFQFFPRIQ